jgi:hypothetical protein
MPKEEQDFLHKHNKMIYSRLKKLAPNRMYVVGNDDSISSVWSRLMIENESETPAYDEMCLFVQNEAVTPISIHNLVHRYGNSWQIKEIIPKRLDEMQNEAYIYLLALDRSRSNSEAREMTANYELYIRAMGYHDNSTDYNSEVDRTKLESFCLIFLFPITSLMQLVKHNLILWNRTITLHKKWTIKFSLIFNRISKLIEKKTFTL